jgi:hypothetical protein
MSTTRHPEWKATRVVHLAGGCRAFNGFDPHVALVPLAKNGKHANFSARAYGSLFADCETLGLKIIGVDFYTHGSQIRGHDPAEWRPYHQRKYPIWICEDETQRWSQIKHQAFEKKDGIYFDLAARISHQLRTCAWRLKQDQKPITDSF